MVVVTSPIGDQAPPALADITTIPTNIQRVLTSWISFLRSDTITIVVVRLSSAAEKKKVSTHIIQSNLLEFWVLIRSVITAKPS